MASPNSRAARARAGRTARAVARTALRPIGLEDAARRQVGRRRTARAIRSKTSDESKRWASVKQEVQTAISGEGPIIVGPWLSEVGFEVLYWIPFLRWLVEHFEVDPSRLHVISRGGTASWYSGIAENYVDLFEFMTPDEYRQHTEKRWQAVGGQKQMELNRWDRAIVDAAGRRLPRDRKTYLHPSLMYRLFQQFWKDAAPLHHVQRHTSVTRLQAPKASHWEERLPKEPFVAVKFYFRPSFPDLPMNRRAVRDCVSNLASQQHVVVMNTGLKIDDHDELDPNSQGNVTYLWEGIPPEENLLVQSLMISRATAFVGTYGGLSYLAPFYGVPSVAFYSEVEHFLPAHLHFARTTLAVTGGSLTTISTRHDSLLSPPAVSHAL